MLVNVSKRVIGTTWFIRYSKWVSGKQQLNDTYIWNWSQMLAETRRVYTRLNNKHQH